MSLPTDVIDHILTFLRSDFATLKKCSQSHPILSNLSDRYLYAHVTLHDDLQEWSRIETWFRTSEFTQILARTPDIGNHVRSLTVICVEGVDLDSEQDEATASHLDGDLGSQQREATSSHLDGVASLLPMFSRLTSFEIVGQLHAQKRCDFRWHTVHETFCRAFLRLLHSQVTKEIFIRGINFFPLSLLNDCRNVRVTLEACKETQYDKKSNSINEYPLVPFEHLTIQHCSDTCLENIAPWMEKHGLHSLEYVDYDCDPDESATLFQRLLVVCSNSLTDLHLRIDGYHTSYRLSNDSAIHLNGEIVRYPFTLADLCHLTRLTISTHSYLCPSVDGCWTLNSPIPAISMLISTALPALQEISLESLFNFQNDFEQLPGPVVIWFPFIPIAAKCSSASISMSISPLFWFPSGYSFDIFSPFTDYKGLAPYVQKGVVVISSASKGRCSGRTNRAFDIKYDNKCHLEDEEEPL